MIRKLGQLVLDYQCGNEVDLAVVRGEFVYCDIGLTAHIRSPG